LPVARFVEADSFFTTTATSAFALVFAPLINSLTFDSLEDAVATIGRAAFSPFLEDSVPVLTAARAGDLADATCFGAVLALDRTAARLALLATALALAAFFLAAATALSSLVDDLALLLLCDAAFRELFCVFWPRLVDLFVIFLRDAMVVFLQTHNVTIGSAEHKTAPDNRNDGRST
jgi:hypothetical protein